MESLEQYNEMLRNCADFGRGFQVFIVIFSIACLIVCLRLEWKNGVIMITAFCVFGLIGTYFFEIYPYEKDIEENSYIVYTGEFYIEGFYFNGGKSLVYIEYPDKDKIIRYRRLCDNTNIDIETWYEGTLVYSKRSNCMVDIIVDPLGES